MKALGCVVVLIMFLGVGCNTSKEDNGRNDINTNYYLNQDYTKYDTSDVEGIYLVDINFEHPETMPSVNPEDLQKNLIYPGIASRALIEGRVIILVYITDKGKPLQTKVVDSPNSVLDEAAINTIMKTKFKPATQFNKPIGAFLEVPVEFKLENRFKYMQILIRR